MESADKESIVREEMERVRNGPEFNWEMASRWGNNLRPDLDVQGYCPKCAKYYPKSDALKKGIDRCEFCGTKIRYSDILTLILPTCIMNIWNNPRLAVNRTERRGFYPENLS